MFRSLFLCLIVFHLFTGCRSDLSDDRTLPELKISPAPIVRIDQELCRNYAQSGHHALNQITRAYPVFSEVFFHQVIFPQNTETIPLDSLIHHYCISPAIRHLTDTSLQIFPDLHELEKKTGTINAYLQHYFPNKPVPEYFSFVSEFGVGVFTVDTRVAAIGLDFFLGEDYPYYDSSVFPFYRRQTMTPEYMASGLVTALAEALIPGITTGNMLDFMIRNGKVLYLASHLLPEEPMYRLNLYTLKDMNWVESNELEIWSFFLDLGMFYDSDLRNFQKYVNPGPSSPGMPESAPARIANWIGYKIIEAYMKQHPEISLKELVEDTDYQKIMDQSKYKPRRK